MVGGPDVCRGMAKAGTATARRSEKCSDVHGSLRVAGPRTIEHEQERGGYKFAVGRGDDADKIR